jgi:hypothetical protein
MLETKEAVWYLSDADLYNEKVVDEYIGETKRGLTDRRKTKVRLTLNKLGREFLKKPLDAVTKDDLEEFLDELRDGDEFAGKRSVYLFHAVSA